MVGTRCPGGHERSEQLCLALVIDLGWASLAHGRGIEWITNDDAWSVLGMRRGGTCPPKGVPDQLRQEDKSSILAANESFFEKNLSFYGFRVA